MPATFAFTCGACGTVHHLPRALSVECPVCAAKIGTYCWDRRSKEPRRRISVHPEREALLPT